MRFSPNQFAILRSLAKGPIPFAEFAKFDQRSLRGLYQRGMFSLSLRLRASITDTGWEAYRACLDHPRFRHNPQAPTFNALFYRPQEVGHRVDWDVA
jgi:hypothetical protein